MALKKLSGESSRIFSFGGLEALLCPQQRLPWLCWEQAQYGPARGGPALAPAPSPGLFHVKDPVRETTSFPQRSPWEVPAPLPRVLHRLPRELTCPFHAHVGVPPRPSCTAGLGFAQRALLVPDRAAISVSFLTLQKSSKLKTAVDAAPSTDRPLLKDVLPGSRRD